MLCTSDCIGTATGRSLVAPWPYQYFVYTPFDFTAKPTSQEAVCARGIGTAQHWPCLCQHA